MRPLVIALIILSMISSPTSPAPVSLDSSPSLAPSQSSLSPATIYVLSYPSPAVVYSESNFLSALAPYNEIPLIVPVDEDHPLRSDRPPALSYEKEIINVPGSTTWGPITFHIYEVPPSGSKPATRIEFTYPNGSKLYLFMGYKSENSIYVPQMLRGYLYSITLPRTSYKLYYLVSNRRININSGDTLFLSPSLIEIFIVVRNSVPYLYACATVNVDVSEAFASRGLSTRAREVFTGEYVNLPPGPFAAIFVDPSARFEYDLFDSTVRARFPIDSSGYIASTMPIVSPATLIYSIYDLRDASGNSIPRDINRALNASEELNASVQITTYDLGSITQSYKFSTTVEPPVYYDREHERKIALYYDSDHQEELERNITISIGPTPIASIASGGKPAGAINLPIYPLALEDLITNPVIHARQLEFSTGTRARVTNGTYPAPARASMRLIALTPAGPVYATDRIPISSPTTLSPTLYSYTLIGTSPFIELSVRGATFPPMNITLPANASIIPTITARAILFDDIFTHALAPGERNLTALFNLRPFEPNATAYIYSNATSTRHGVGTFYPRLPAHVLILFNDTERLVNASSRDLRFIRFDPQLLVPAGVSYNLSIRLSAGARQRTIDLPARMPSLSGFDDRLVRFESGSYRLTRARENFTEPLDTRLREVSITLYVGLPANLTFSYPRIAPQPAANASTNPPRYVYTLTAILSEISPAALYISTTISSASFSLTATAASLTLYAPPRPASCIRTMNGFSVPLARALEKNPLGYPLVRPDHTILLNITRPALFPADRNASTLEAIILLNATPRPYPILNASPALPYYLPLPFDRNASLEYLFDGHRVRLTTTFLANESLRQFEGTFIITRAYLDGRTILSSFPLGLLGHPLEVYANASITIRDATFTAFARNASIISIPVYRDVLIEFPAPPVGYINVSGTLYAPAQRTIIYNVTRAPERVFDGYSLALAFNDTIVIPSSYLIDVNATTANGYPVPKDLLRASRDNHTFYTLPRASPITEFYLYARLRNGDLVFIARVETGNVTLPLVRIDVRLEPSLIGKAPRGYSVSAGLARPNSTIPARVRYIDPSGHNRTRLIDVPPTGALAIPLYYSRIDTPSLGQRTFNVSAGYLRIDETLPARVSVKLDHFTSPRNATIILHPGENRLTRADVHIYFYTFLSPLPISISSPHVSLSLPPNASALLPLEPLEVYAPANVSYTRIVHPPAENATISVPIARVHIFSDLPFAGALILNATRLPRPFDGYLRTPPVYEYTLLYNATITVARGFLIINSSSIRLPAAVYNVSIRIYSIDGHLIAKTRRILPEGSRNVTRRGHSRTISAPAESVSVTYPALAPDVILIDRFGTPLEHILLNITPAPFSIDPLLVEINKTYTLTLAVPLRNGTYTLTLNASRTSSSALVYSFPELVRARVYLNSTLFHARALTIQGLFNAPANVSLRIDEFSRARNATIILNAPEIPVSLPRASVTLYSLESRPLPRNATIRLELPNASITISSNDFELPRPSNATLTFRARFEYTISTTLAPGPNEISLPIHLARLRRRSPIDASAKLQRNGFETALANDSITIRPQGAREIISVSAFQRALAPQNVTVPLARVHIYTLSTFTARPLNASIVSSIARLPENRSSSVSSLAGPELRLPINSSITITATLKIELPEATLVVSAHASYNISSADLSLSLLLPADRLEFHVVYPSGAPAPATVTIYGAPANNSLLPLNTRVNVTVATDIGPRTFEASYEANSTHVVIVAPVAELDIYLIDVSGDEIPNVSRHRIVPPGSNFTLERLGMTIEVQAPARGGLFDIPALAPADRFLITPLLHPNITASRTTNATPRADGFVIPLDARARARLNVTFHDPLGGTLNETIRLTPGALSSYTLTDPARASTILFVTLNARAYATLNARLLNVTHIYSLPVPPRGNHTVVFASGNLSITIPFYLAPALVDPPLPTRAITPSGPVNASKISLRPQGELEIIFSRTPDARQRYNHTTQLAPAYTIDTLVFELPVEENYTFTAPAPGLIDLDGYTLALETGESYTLAYAPLDVFPMSLRPRNTTIPAEITPAGLEVNVTRLRLRVDTYLFHVESITLAASGYSVSFHASAIEVPLPAERASVYIEISLSLGPFHMTYTTTLSAPGKYIIRPDSIALALIILSTIVVALALVVIVKTHKFALARES